MFDNTVNVNQNQRQSTTNNASTMKQQYSDNVDNVEHYLISARGEIYRTNSSDKYLGCDNTPVCNYIEF